MKRFLLATFAAFAIAAPAVASEGGNGEGVTQTIQEQIELLGATGFTITERKSDGTIPADGGAAMAGLNSGLEGGEGNGGN